MTLYHYLKESEIRLRSWDSIGVGIWRLVVRYGALPISLRLLGLLYRILSMLPVLKPNLAYFRCWISLLVPEVRNTTPPPPHTHTHTHTFREDKFNTNSPADPLFYLHHAAIDWFWWIWQSQDPARLEEISGGTILGDPNSAKTTLETALDIGPLGPVITIADVMDIQGGGLMCYEYV